MKSADRILFTLKTRGPLTAQALGEMLELSSMGARRHLEQWLELGLVEYYEQAEKQGRPNRYWQLSEAGHARFPDRHNELTLQLINSVRELFGEQGLNKLIANREQQSLALYQDKLSGYKSLRAKAKALAQLRNEEGYMAELSTHDEGGFLLIENHCPICAAATACQNFCRSELKVFQKALGDEVIVQRQEHLLSEGRRCVYWIKPN
ncbi:transcriptional regulator [Undibacterium cyanobacteriorum]|uniref:Transcriptional regulator n=1 Tax=Undibacterium cyanobacteriorum TaxID=3073561 RepID=A0ABY9RKX6_9BURK|nr:metalloregulator ArsR/SmtB family transcription factor [Undibacterium sp. 20NA77.5]WMW81012.1 transcriptional regulator [Undibacterium sp. 20NA77.5]